MVRERQATGGDEVALIPKLRFRLAGTAFHAVLRRKQSKYGIVLAWLARLVAASTPTITSAHGRLDRAAIEGQRAFRQCRY